MTLITAKDLGHMKKNRLLFFYQTSMVFIFLSFLLEGYWQSIVVGIGATSCGEAFVEGIMEWPGLRELLVAPRARFVFRLLLALSAGAIFFYGDALLGSNTSAFERGFINGFLFGMAVFCIVGPLFDERMTATSPAAQ